MNSWIIENLGWALLHSLWQISFVALSLFIALRVLREFSANYKYSASISALILSLMMPIATFIYLSQATPNIGFKPISQTPPKLNIEQSSPNRESENISQNIQSSSSVSPNIARTSPSSTIPFLPILVVLWLIGVLLFSIRLAGGVWTIHLYKTRKVSAVENHWQERFDEICKSLQIRQKVKFLQSKMVETPVVIGWLKPVILVPASAFLQISPKELETILIHELTHIKRHDYLINLLQSLVEILFFFHPCVWWISAQIRAEREFAVDEFIAQSFETERVIYAKALATLEESRPTQPILAMAADGGNLMKRIEKILNGSRKINSTNVSIWSAVFAVTLILGLTAGIYWIKTNENTQTKKGRKITIIFSNYSDKPEKDVPYQYLAQLQNKFNIPATWILDSDLIETLKRNETAQSFFQQAKEHRSEFIVKVPNINYTIFINGDDEYISLWKKRVQFVDEYLVNTGDNLKYYTINYKSQIPQEMENSLITKGLKQIEVPYLLDSGYQFSFQYQKDCIKVEKTFSCKERSAEKQKEIREKYIQYMNEIFELNEKFSQEKFGATSPQVLYLIGDELTRDSADALLQMLQDKGYKFVPLEEVTTNEMFKKLQTPSRENADLYQKKWKILDKYLDKPFLNSNKSTEELKKATENFQKSFKVEVTTKDLKPKP